MKKRSILFLIPLLTAFGSFFFPYIIEYSDQRRILWYDSNEIHVDYVTGFELGIPLIALPAFLGAFLIIVFVRKRAGNIIALVLSCTNVLAVFVVYFGMHININFFASVVTETGDGFMVLLVAQLLLLGVSIYNAKIPYNLSNKPPETELLDEDI